MHTLAFKPSIGWTTFYSYTPEAIQGLNRHLYTFKGGNLFKHNTNPVHNSFYGQEVESMIVVPFNDVPMKSKVFKSMSLNGDSAWDTLLNTDLTIDDDFVKFDGEIYAEQYVEKEGEFYGYIRVQDNNVQMANQKMAHRTTIGLGVPDSIVADANPANSIVKIPTTSMISESVVVGDDLYRADIIGGEVSSATLLGSVISIDKRKRFGFNDIVVNATGLSDSDYYIVSKKIPQESSGLVGHYMRAQLKLPYTAERKEIFSIRVETMRSFY